jgi:hypothetical protein
MPPPVPGLPIEPGGSVDGEADGVLSLSRSWLIPELPGVPCPLPGPLGPPDPVVPPAPIEEPLAPLLSLGAWANAGPTISIITATTATPFIMPNPPLAGLVTTSGRAMAATLVP